MTIGNKYLMMSDALKGQTQLLVTIQNSVAVVVLSLASVSGVFKVMAVDRQQLLFYCWDAVVLVVQIWTAFEAFRHLPVAGTTVVRALAIPFVAWVEWLVLGTRLSTSQHLWSWLVVLGAALYAYEDVMAAGFIMVGYAWAFANLLSFVSNSVLDRVMMSRSEQTAGGMALLTQLISIPISIGQGVLVDGLTATSTAAVLRSLDAHTSIILAATGAVAGLLGSCYAQCYKRASATAVTLAGNCNKALSVLASVLCFGFELSAVQIAGLCICLGGALGYSLLSLGLTSPAVPTRASAPTMAFKTDTPRPDLQSGLDFTWDKPWGDSKEISDKAGLQALAKKLNPILGYWDPMNIGETSKENIAWFRHAEIKHGRVAMAAFVGFTVQAAGLHFPWGLTGTVSYADISAAGGPGDQWDALPSASKMQILLFIGFLELWSESHEALALDGQKHYVRGGKPGHFPSMKNALPHPIPFDLFDPFGLSKNATPEQKEQGLLKEINNGRAAMLGMFGYVSASKGLIVPGLDSLPLKPYAGEFMAPFSAINADLPFVQAMLDLRTEQIAREATFLNQVW